MIDRVVEIPEVVLVDLLLHLRLLGHERVEIRIRSAELRGDLVEAVEQVALRAHAVLDVAAHVLGLIELRLLLEQTDRCALREVGVAARRLLDAGHDAQHCRLAGAVRPEHADLRARQKRERDVVEHLALRAVELRDPDHREDVVRQDRRD